MRIGILIIQKVKKKLSRDSNKRSINNGRGKKRKKDKRRNRTDRRK